MLTYDDGSYKCDWMDTSDDFDCETVWPTPPPDTGCCMGETEYSHDRCAMSGEKDRCNRISGCHWLSTDDPADCIFVPPTTTPPPPGCCYLHSSQNPMSGWADRCADYFSEGKCTGPEDKNGNSRCMWSDAPEGTDCENYWPSTTPSVGCCAGDSEGATDRCGQVDSKWDCNSRSSCHWRDGDGADCMTPQDGDGVNRCSWTPTAEDVDCTILWPTEGPAGSWVTVHPAQQQQNLLFGYGIDDTMAEAMDSRVSLSSVLLMVFAAFAMYKIFHWMFARKKETKYEGYQPLSDTVKHSVASHNGYHSISA